MYCSIRREFAVTVEVSTKELLVARDGLDVHKEKFAALNAQVGVEVLPLARQYNLRVSPNSDSAVAVEAQLGSALPTSLSWVSSPAGQTIIWLGPDEWLIIDTTNHTDFEASLRAATKGHGAVVDQSGQRISLLVTGDAPGLLAKGTALNLHPTVFPRGSALQGFLARAVMIYLSRSENSSRIELLVRTSFARYVADWLLDAALDPLAYPTPYGERARDRAAPSATRAYPTPYGERACH